MFGEVVRMKTEEEVINVIELNLRRQTMKQFFFNISLVSPSINWSFFDTFSVLMFKKNWSIIRRVQKMLSFECLSLNKMII